MPGLIVDVRVSRNSLADFAYATDRFPSNLDLELDRAYQRIGQNVRADAVERVDPHDPFSAAGYRSVVESNSVTVGQSLPETTGAHPEWADWQMKHALVPASDDPKVDAEFEEAVGRACDKWEA